MTREVTGDGLFKTVVMSADQAAREPGLPQVQAVLKPLVAGETPLPIDRTINLTAEQVAADPDLVAVQKALADKVKK